jgi:tRNA 2-thiouridine synthesizing protein E
MYATKLNEPELPELDDAGLLLDPSQWSESVAWAMAERFAVGPLTEAHWRIIYAIRAHHNKYGVPPVMGRMCRKQGMDLDCIHRLFCSCLNAWRVAGLPDPGEEAKSYLSAM